MTIELEVPGDKSLAHRYLIFDFLSGSRSNLYNLPLGEDVLHTKYCLERIKQKKGDLYCGNSGTTARLLAGLLTGIEGKWKLSGDDSLSARPMNRVANPLKNVGAKIIGDKLPLTIESSKLQPIEYKLPIASAQIKSCLLLAGLVQGIPVKLTGKVHSRDHTEIFLEEQNLKIRRTANKIILNDSSKNLKPFDVIIPGDPSSAAFLIIRRILTPGDDLIFKNILLNPARIYYLEILKAIGCLVRVENEKVLLGEKVGDIIVKHREFSELKNIPEISNSSFFIDEIPALSLLMTQISGNCIIKDVEELKVKETDRIEELKKMYQSFKIQKNLEYQDGDLIINGEQSLSRNDFESTDHRIQMTAALIGSKFNQSINVSFPEFPNLLKKL